MSPANNTALTGKGESHSSTTRKPSSARSQDPAVKCPRCDSPNTKFCYYNNYSLSQPRHFCKTCRRYWTKGGALRNVPIGGGCRKNKKMRSSPRLSGDSKDSSGSSEAGGLKFFQGLSPAMDFQLGGIGINIPKLHPSNANTNLFSQFPSHGGLSTTSSAITHNACFNLDPSLMGFGFPLSSSLKQGQEMGSVNVHSNLASSIESLSSINQDLHWKLQQQRLATLYDEHGPKGTSGNIDKPQPQPIQLQNLENQKADSFPFGTSRKDGNFSTPEWVFSYSYAPAAPIPATSSGNDLTGNSQNWSAGTQPWNELTQYSASLP